MLRKIGLQLDENRNEHVINLGPGEAARISRDGSRLAAYVVATDEERVIAKETASCLEKS